MRRGSRDHPSVHGIAWFLFLGLLSSCASFSARDPHVFVINGRTIQVTDGLLKELRGHWVTGEAGPFRTVLPLDDAQWVSDFISISELVDKRHCKTLKLLATERREAHDDIVEGKTVRSGAFDEMWSIDACGETHRYRVFNPKGSTWLQVERMH
jgi:hypothetical protein